MTPYDAPTPVNETEHVSERTDSGSGWRGPYELLDFGDGRKLESLAGYIIDRPSPAAVGVKPASPRRWANADAKFDSATKRWSFRRPFPKSLLIDCDRFVMPVQPTPFGHIGIFPEQAANWRWLADQVSELAEAERIAAQGVAEPNRKAVSAAAAGVTGLNLFGYTGASSLALAAAGAEVGHVDAAKPNVEAAKAAAEASGLRQAPVRYLVEDARKFVRRELRRRRRYKIVSLDPPAYGHGPGGKAWRLERDVWPLLEDCLRLIGRDKRMEQTESARGKSPAAPARLLLTGHSESVGPQMILSWLRSNSDASFHAAYGRSELADRRGRQLDAGFYFRATWS